MASRDDDLEFISVGRDDESNEMLNANAYIDPSSGDSGYDNVVGSWFLKQSKVSC
jgi:hypothetical protein